MSLRKALSLVVVLISLCSFLAACAQPAPPPQPKKIRIGVATFSHETCTFCPDPTGIAEWEFYGPPVRGNDVLNQGVPDRFADLIKQIDTTNGNGNKDRQ